MSFNNAGINLFLSYSFDFIIWFFLTTYVIQLYSYIVSITRYYVLSKSLYVIDFTVLQQIKSLPKITFIIPAYNEEVTIVSVVNVILNLSYPNLEIVVVDAGSSDSTLSLLKNNFDLFPLPPVIGQKIPTKKIENYYKSINEPRLTVIEKKDNSKSDAQNAALNICDSLFFISLDADTLINDKEFMKTILYFLSRPNIYSMGAMVGVGNEAIIEENVVARRQFPSKFLNSLQRIDYEMMIIGFRFGHVYDGGNIIVPGAFGIFNYAKVMEARGYSDDTLLDDVDLTLTLVKKSYEELNENLVDTAPFVPCLTYSPNNIKEIVSQRERWQRGTLQALKKHRKMFFSYKYENTGTLGLPYYLFQISIMTLVQLFVLMIIPIAFYVNFYDIKRVFLYLGILLLIRFSEYTHLFFVRNIILDRFVSIREGTKIVIASVFFAVTLDPILFFSKVLGILKFFKGDISWKKLKRFPYK